MVTVIVVRTTAITLLKMNILRCIFTYRLDTKWVLYNADDNPMISIMDNKSSSTTGWTRESLVINAYVLAPNQMYKLVLEYGYSDSKARMKTSYTIMTCDTPQKGYCSVVG